MGSKLACWPSDRKGQEEGWASDDALGPHKTARRGACGPRAAGFRPLLKRSDSGYLAHVQKTKIKPTSRRIAKAHIAWHVLISFKKKAPGISNLRHFQCRNVLRTCLKRRSFSNTYFREAINCKARCLAVDCCKADCRGLVMSVLVHTYM